MNRCFLTMITGCLLLAVFFSDALAPMTVQAQGKAAPAKTAAPLPRLQPSTALEDLRAEIEKNPMVSRRKLATMGNRLLRQKGCNYYLEMCAPGKANQQPKPIRLGDHTVMRYLYTLALSNGERQRFQILIEQPDAHDGGCSFAIPCLQVGANDLTILASAGGADRTYTIKRRADFRLNEVELVDKRMKRVIRRWTTPHQTDFVGISADGTRLYAEPYVDGLLLEVAADGIRLRAASEVKFIGESVLVENAPVTKKTEHLTYVRFRAGKTSYILRYVAPHGC